MIRIKEIFTNEKYLLLIFFVLSFSSRIFFLGSSLWHDDAFNFVDKAINLAVNGQYLNAHSTGYPFWTIFLSIVIKIGHFFTGKWSIVFLPNLISAIFGSLLVFPIYRLSKKVLNSSFYSFLLTSIILINPVIWRWSEIAMNDIFTLFFVIYSIVFFIEFIEKDKSKYLWLSNLFIYLFLMNRILYGLIFLPFLIFWIINKGFNFKKLSYILSNWLLVLVSVIITYGFFNDLTFFTFLSSYGSVLPTFKEFIKSSLIIFRSVGPIIGFLSGLGLILLFRKNRKYFYFLSSILITFLCYLSSWYRNGFFDIERYSILLTVILLIFAGYCLVFNKITRILFLSSLVLLVFLFFKGINLPINQYTTFASSDGSFMNYMLKSAQISQQTKIDFDLQTYQDLSNYVTDQDVIFHWKNDWIMPKLLLNGSHLQERAKLIGIKSKKDLEEKILIYRNRKIYLLRGAYESYLEIGEEYKSIETKILNKQTIVNFIPSD